MKALAARLRDERGIALVMALGIATVLGISAASLVAYSVVNEEEASRSKTNLRAYQLAQSGIDSAASQLSQATQPQLIEADFFEATSADGDADPAVLSASSRTASLDGGAVTWTGTLESTALSVPAGAAPLYRYVWHLAATATLPNPAAAGSNVTRTVRADVSLVPSPGQPANNLAWRYVYSKKTGTPGGCDEVVYNNTTLRSPMYVAGNLCWENSTSLIGPANPATDEPVDLIVQGIAYINYSNSFAGYDKDPPAHIQPLSNVWFNGGCKYLNNPLIVPPATCGTAQNVWALLNDTSPAGPPWETSKFGYASIPAPVADFNNWYEEASPGPRAPCETGLSTGAYPQWDNYPTPGNVYSASHNWDADETLGVFDITPSSSYECVTAGGYIKWNASTKVLKVNGTMFFDGDAQIKNAGQVRYEGMGTIYLGGSFYLKGSQVCAKSNAGNTDCDFADWDNYATNLLAIVAERSGGVAPAGIGIHLDQASYQGALYAATNIQISQSANAQGPMIAEQEVIRNNSDTQGIPDFGSVPYGLPGNAITTYRMTTPRFYSG